MSSPTKVLTFEDVLKRVRNIQKTAAAQGDKVTDVRDATDTGTITPPTHPSEAKTNAALPGGNPLTTPQGKPTPTIEGKQAEGTLEKPTPSTVNGTAQDARVDTSTAKIASDAKAIAARVKGMLGKSASDFEIEKKKDVGASGDAPKSKTDAADPTDKGNVAPGDDRGPDGLPTKAKVNEAPDNGSDKAKEAAAEALASDITLSRESYVKLASMILESEDGVKFATRILKEAKGAEVANQLITAALQAQDTFNKAAAAEAQGAELAEAMFKSASVEDQALIIKYAQVHSASAAEIDSDPTLTPEQKQTAKLAYAQGAMDGAAMQDAGALPPEAGGELPPEAGGLPGGESETPSIEDIVAVIEQLVQSGQLPMEVAQQLVQELIGAEGGGAAAGGEEASAGEGIEAPGQEVVEADAAAKAAGAHVKSASDEQKVAAEMIRAMLPTKA